MEAPGNNQVPIQCRSGCGFYGTPATEGMCSKCYKDYLKKSQVPPSGLSGPSFRGGSDVVTVGGASSASSPASSNLVTRAACVDTASPTFPVIGASGSASSSSSRKASGGVEKDPKTDVSSVSGAIAAAVPEPAAAKSADAAGAGAAIAALSMDAEAPGSPSTSTDENSEKKKKNRCAICRKKVGLTGFGCRCGGLYCALHRYSDKHDCTFDYRAHGAEEIRRNNPVVKGEKIRQI